MLPAFILSLMIGLFGLNAYNSTDKKTAFDAFKMTKQGQSKDRIDGFTPDQRFFPGFAQGWRLKTRDESMRVRVTTDPHSPEMYRVNGPVMNFDPFYAAFAIKEGEPCIKSLKKELKFGRQIEVKSRLDLKNRGWLPPKSIILAKIKPKS